MFLKKLVIDSNLGIIRKINFKKELNLIIDKVQEDNRHESGNNIGKTTILKLIDVCLGKESNIIYTDTENSKKIYKKVKDFLISKEVIIKLTLVDSLNETIQNSILIERNFLKGKSCIYRINGQNYASLEMFKQKLKENIFSNLNMEGPSFRQIIFHNIRYKNERIEEPLSIDKYSKDIEIQSLLLFLLGTKNDESQKLINLKENLKNENKFLNRLEKENSISEYSILLTNITEEISDLIKKRDQLNINHEYDNDIKKLDEVKENKLYLTGINSTLKIKLALMKETEIAISNNNFDIDTNQLKDIYEEATNYFENLSVSFEKLLDFHKTLQFNKLKYIKDNFKKLDEVIKINNQKIMNFILKEKQILEKLQQTNTFKDLEKLNISLDGKLILKGEYESKIKSINETKNNIRDYTNKINNDILFSDAFHEKLLKQIENFNKYFTKISQSIYNESYFLNVDKTKSRDDSYIYKFNTFSDSMGSGKKQGEVLCFDIAFIEFKNSQNIPTLNFILNDKKELVDSRQLISIANYIKGKDIQIVFSILSDKLPNEFSNDSIIELYDSKKLFKIEEFEKKFDK